jgi:hypothetical protein
MIRARLIDSFHLAQTGHVVLEAGREVHDAMTKAQAASMIEELQPSTRRGGTEPVAEASIPRQGSGPRTPTRIRLARHSAISRPI